MSALKFSGLETLKLVDCREKIQSAEREKKVGNIVQ